MKTNIKIIIVLIIAVILSTTLSYCLAETLIDSKNVYYKDNSDLGFNNVQDAIDGTCVKFDNNLTNLKKEIINEMYPVGSIYISTSLDTKEKVGEALGGTWESYGAGRTLVGTGTSDKEFKINETGGESTHKLTIDEMPSHTHTFTGKEVTTSKSGIHTHRQNGWTVVISQGTNTGGWDIVGNSKNTGNVYPANDDPAGGRVTDSAGEHTHTVTANGSNSSTGGSKEHNNLQPYTVVYMYKRVS